jgi:hypothetical protein
MPSNRWGTCSNSPGAEVCDGIDNNCNGTIDEGISPAPCEVPNLPGLVYQDAFAQSVCIKGQLPCNGTCSGWVGPTQEICDGLDNDCDGLVDAADPNMVGAGQPCGSAQGTCTKGTSACLNGVLVCQGGSAPQPEMCDGKDNDCNGFVDDGALLDAPGPSDHPCWNLPAGTCTPVCSYVGSSATTEWCPPAGANCHDLGTLTAPPCAIGYLGCIASSWKCVGGTLPANEACDGVDNNCNGSIDDNLPTTPCGSNVGLCEMGTQICVKGVVTCDGAIGPVTEICDAKDNDCDGVIDNGIAIGSPCQAAYDTTTYPGPRDKGICSPGVTECGAGGETLCVGGTGPGPEICDGLDNDCDGQVDESGTPPEGINGTADPKDPSRVIGLGCGKDVGACKPGVWACSASQFICSGGVGAQVEVCDCIDNDCDGLVDEDPTPGSNDPAMCGASKVCVAYGVGCQCAAKCNTGEFPCPTGGYACKAVDKSGATPPESAGNRCVTEPCLDCSAQTILAGGSVECAPVGTVLDGGAKPPQCVCKGQPGCHNPCYGVSCSAPMVCTDFGAKAGTCVTDSCWNVPCQVAQVCNLGSCVRNPCKADSCKANEACKPNADFTKFECKASCAGVGCKATEQCLDGKCVPTGCSQPCPTGQVCSGGDAGACIKVKCEPNPCTDGSWCNPATGSCGNDPCSGVICPSGQSCTIGQCVTTILDGGSDVDGSGGKGGSSQGDAGGKGGAGASSGTGAQGSAEEDRRRWGLATGGGGCSCTMGIGLPKAASGFALAAAAMTLVAFRRRKRVDEE